MSDKITALIERNHLSDLVLASTQPDVRAHTIPRVSIPMRDPASARELEQDYEPSVSPLAVLIVMAMLAVVFVAIVQL